MGPWWLAANIVTIVVGAGIFVVPAALAANIGPYAPLAFLACGVAVGAVAICFAEGGSRIATSGGVYGYVEAAFGPLTGWVAGSLLILSDVLACGGVAAALADAAAGITPAGWRAPAHAAVIVVVIGGIALINIGGIKRGAWLVSLVTTLKLIPLVVFVVVGAWALHGANFARIVKPGTQGLGRALLLALFALTGMESSLSVSGEVKDPSRTIPRALAISLGTVILLYMAIQSAAQGILGASLAHSAMPLADAMGRISPALRGLMLAGAGISMLGWLSGDLLAAPRLLFAFGRDGMLPRVIGRVHSRSHAPHVAIACYAAIAVALALTGTFVELAVLSTLASSVLYMAGCAAAWQLARRGVAEAGVPLNFRWLGAAAVVGVASMAVMIALASRTEIVGLFAVTGASVIIYFVQTRVRRLKTPAETPAG